MKLSTLFLALAAISFAVVIISGTLAPHNPVDVPLGFVLLETIICLITGLKLVGSSEKDLKIMKKSTALFAYASMFFIVTIIIPILFPLSSTTLAVSILAGMSSMGFVVRGHGRRAFEKSTIASV